MKKKGYINPNIENVKEHLDKLEELFTTMISDLHEIKGMAQARIAYIYYRDIVWSAKKVLNSKSKE